MGTGLSSRPRFDAKSTKEAEAFFVDSLEKWREAQNLDEFILVGHSMGGYLASVYTMKYPERVKHLVMVCPAGVGQRPDGWQPPESLRSPWTLRGQLYRFAKFVWNAGATPGGIIRLMGPWGPGMVEKYTRRRFRTGHHLMEEEIDAFHRYMYGILAAKGSGEYALRHILEPFAFPRDPLELRMKTLSVPITFIYGDQDWMDPKAAERVVASIKDARGSKSPGDLKVIMTPSAGHYPFLDQPGIFLHDLLDACGHHLPVDLRNSVKKVADKHPLVTGAPFDTKEEMDKEMKSDPAAAEAHMASDM